MKITTVSLKRLNACSKQVEAFRALATPARSIDVTEEWCATHAQTFQWDWAAERLLPAPARAEYRRVKAAARAKYEHEEHPAWLEYRRVKVAALAEYARVMAPTFGRLLNQTERS